MEPMTQKELKEYAIKQLNSKPVQKIKLALCKQFSDKKEQLKCMKSFDKYFIRSFIDKYNSDNNIMFETQKI